MKKKIIYAMAIMSLILFLPAFAGTAAVSPEMIDDNNVVAQDTFDYDGNTVEIVEKTDDSTQLLLNDTYQLDVTHNETNVGVKCTLLDTGLIPQADETVFDVDFSTTEEGQTIRIETPDFSLELESSGKNGDQWDGQIYGLPELILFTYNSTNREFAVFDGTHEVLLQDDLIIIDGGLIDIFRFNETAWIINSPMIGGMLVANWNPGMGYFGIEYIPIFVAYGTPPPGYTPLYADATISIAIDFNGLSISWGGVSIYIHAYMFILIFDYISITWYYGFIIERIVLLIWDITIIIYITIVELLLVIIYYTFEIKFYESQIVLVYEYIEIIFVFISLTIWEITFIFHFEFWFIQIIFITIININIIVPVRLIFIPILIPIFIPVIYYVPVMILVNVHIYMPYASPALLIDVYDEVLGTPEHTIQYRVTDQAGLPVDDATVSVSYDGSDTPATFVSNGVYEVVLPASNVTETIIVTATKTWYPDGILTYDMEVDWVTNTITITPTTPLPIGPIVAALACLALGTTLIRKRKK